LVYVSPTTPFCNILPTAIAFLVLVLDGYYQYAGLCVLTSPGLAFAHGTAGAKRTVGETFKKKKCEALQYCDSNEFIELTVGTSRVLMSKAATNNICSNKHKA
jgi:hypothetical protein